VSAGQYVYEYLTHGRVTPSAHARRLSNKFFRAANSTIEKNLVSGSLPPPWAEDFLRIARAVFLADKVSPRKHCRDGWTRSITLTIQLIEPELWQGRAEPILATMLEVLTSDRWDIRFQGGARGHEGVPTILFCLPAEEVTLFSGGLDSTTYAAERARVSGGPLLLLSYFHSKMKPRQQEIYDGLDAVREVRNIQLLEQPRYHGLRNELSSRCRGLLYLATAIYLASSHRVAQVSIPENGQLAVNPPLTPARVAAASTRSVHPYFLYLVNRLISTVDGEIRVVNPLLSATKGEVCRRARDSGLSLPTIMRTVSCGRPPWLFRGGNVDHCGCCYPCLIRQSGLLSGVGRDDTPYKVNVWAPGVKPDDRRDLRAVGAWLTNDFGLRDLAVDLPPPPQTNVEALLHTILRGRIELQRLFTHHSQPGIAA
jgi:hypothetical protein